MSSPDVRSIAKPANFNEITPFEDRFWPPLGAPDIGASPVELYDWATLIFQASELNFGDNT